MNNWYSVIENFNIPSNSNRESFSDSRGNDNWSEQPPATYEIKNIFKNMRWIKNYQSLFSFCVKKKKKYLLKYLRKDKTFKWIQFNLLKLKRLGNNQAKSEAGFSLLN